MRISCWACTATDRPRPEITAATLAFENNFMVSPQKIDAGAAGCDALSLRGRRKSNKKFSAYLIDFFDAKGGACWFTLRGAGGADFLRPGTGCCRSMKLKTSLTTHSIAADVGSARKVANTGSGCNATSHLSSLRSRCSTRRWAAARGNVATPKPPSTSWVI